MRNELIIYSLCAGLSGYGPVAMAGNLNVPNTFTGGTPAFA